MHRNGIQLVLVAAIVIAAGLAPLVRGALPCCGCSGNASAETALVVVDSPEPATCGSCCSSDLQGEPRGTADSPAPGGDQPEGPCGDDCGCTLCRIMTSVAPAFVERSGAQWFARSADSVQIGTERVSARQATFGLLRPPQA